nr:putative ribonuclease H-like domain-containing protein [Tanacetum cinerariifolium]
MEVPETGTRGVSGRVLVRRIRKICRSNQHATRSLVLRDPDPKAHLTPDKNTRYRPGIYALWYKYSTRTEHVEHLHLQIRTFFQEAEAVILAEIGMPNHQTMMIRENENDDELHINMDLLQEKREATAIREAKDETSLILKTFITGLENQLSLKVKIIRSDNGTEFKNSDLNQFSELKIHFYPFHFGLRQSILVGKFERKVDERFLVGYSVNSKAFRVFNSRTHIVQETLHVNFLENKPNITCFQDEFDAEKAGEEVNQQYMLFPVWSSGSLNPHNKDGDAAFDGKEHDVDTKEPENRDLNAEFKDHSDNSSNDVNVAGSIVSTVGQNSSNSTNPFSAAGTSNTTASLTHGKSSLKDTSQLLDNPDILEMEDITYSDHENVGAEDDFNNLETSITVSPILATRTHKDHPVSQIIGDLSSTTQTRSMSRVIKDQGGLSQIFNDDFHTCMLFFTRGTQEVARIEAIRLFLAYASFMGFMVYQMDVKSTFLYGTIEEEVYVCQPSGFEDTDHPDKVYKVVKALCDLHQAPRAWYETLANYLLENSFHRGKIDQTLFIKKQKGDILLVQIYVDDIIFGATNKDLCKSFEKLIKDKFQMSSMGELIFFLGLR